MQRHDRQLCVRGAPAVDLRPGELQSVLEIVREGCPQPAVDLLRAWPVPAQLGGQPLDAEPFLGRQTGGLSEARSASCPARSSKPSADQAWASAARTMG